MLKTPLILFFLICCTSLSAQLNVSLTQTEAICSSDGSISATASGGTEPYQYRIVSGPELRGFQSSGTFLALQPGNYSVQVRDATFTSVSENITVSGSYVLPNLNVSITQPSCSSSSDGQVILTGSNGNPIGTAAFPTYRFRIVDLSTTPQTIIQEQNTDTFSGLAEGIYTFQIEDGCQNTVSETITLTAPSIVSLSSAIDFIEKVACDTYEVEYAPFGRGVSPHQVTVTEDATGTVVFSNSIDTSSGLSYSLGTNYEFGVDYTVDVIDACGQTENKPFAFTPDIDMWSQKTLDCSGDTAFFVFASLTSSSSREISMLVPATLTLTNQTNPSDVLVYTFTDPNNLEAEIREADIEIGGTYDVVLEDSCSYTVNTALTFTPVPATTFEANVRPERGCMDGTTGMGFHVRNGGPNYVRVTINSGPASFTSEGGVITNYSYPRTFVNPTGSSVYPEAFPPGIYEAEITDGCESGIETFEILASQTVEHDFSIDFLQGCGNSNALIINPNVISNISNTFYTNVNITNLDTGNSVFRESIYFFTEGTPVTVPNLPAGNYQLNLEFQSGGECTSGRAYTCPCEPQTVNVTIPPFASTSFESIFGYTCTEGSGVIFAEGANGVAPYQYEIIASSIPSNIGRTSTDGIFNSSDEGTYTVRITDSCGNSADGAFEVTPYLPNLAATCDVSGSSVTLTANPVPDAIFTWIDGSGSTVQSGASNELVFDPFNPTQAGNYTLQVSAPGLNCTIYDGSITVPNVPCSSSIDVSKTVESGPIYDAVNDTYTVTYRITAENSGGASGSYDINDTFILGTGFTLIEATLAYGAESDGVDGTILSPFVSGDQIITAESLAGLRTESWLVTAVFSLDIDLFDPTQDCTNGGGFGNQITVTGDTDTSNNMACVPVNIAEIELVKEGLYVDTDSNCLTNVGDEIVYTFTLLNRGNLPLSNIVVSDPLLGGVLPGPTSGDTDGDGELDISETWVYNASFAFSQTDIDNGQVNNLATVNSEAPDGNPVTRTSTDPAPCSACTPDPMCPDCTLVYLPSNPDTDNDGIADVCDLDDDNDGILDTAEIDCAILPIALNNVVNETSLSGSISNLWPYNGNSITLDYELIGNNPGTNPQWGSGISNQNDPSFSPDGEYLNLRPQNTDFGTGDYVSYNLQFSTPVSNLSFNIGGLDNDDELRIYPVRNGSPVGYTITDVNIGPGLILTPTGLVSKGSQANAPSNTITLSIDGSIDGLLILSGKEAGSSYNTNFNTIQFYEMQYCTISDTDNDNIPDIIDLDSDNDGCFDTVEAGHTDGDNDGILGNSPVTVDTDGRVTGQGGYTGTTGNEVIATEAIINTAPSNQTINEGNSTSFTIDITAINTTSFSAGTPDYSVSGATDSSVQLQYQWQENGTNLSNGGNYSGVNTNILTIGDVTGLDGNTYTVIVTHLDNNCINESRSAILTTLNPCDPVASGNPDTDGDGIADVCDLDDDNDGILDANEGLSASSDLISNGDFSNGLTDWSVNNPTGGSALTVGASGAVEFGYQTTGTTAAVFLDPNDLANDASITTQNGSIGTGASGGPAQFHFNGTGDMYVAVDPDSGGSDVGSFNSIDITWEADWGIEGQVYSFGDLSSLTLGNYSAGVNTGLTIGYDNASSQNIILWNGTELLRVSGYYWVAINAVTMNLIISPTGAVSFSASGRGPALTAQIPGTEWQDTNNSSWQFIASQTYAPNSNVNDRINNIEFNGSATEILNNIGDSIEQNFTASVGATSTVLFDILTQGTGSATYTLLTEVLDDLGTVVATNTSTINSGLTTVNFNFSPSSTNSTIRHTLLSASGDLANRQLLLDNISVSEVTAIDTDDDGTFDHLDLDSDNDGCFDTVEAGHSDGDNNGILGTGTVTVDGNGQVTGQGGYTGVTGNEIIATEVTLNTTPSNQAANNGDSASFTVDITALNTTNFSSGTPNYGTGTDSSGQMRFQWQENGTNLSNGVNYSGVDTATLTIADVTGLQNNSYTVQVTHLDNVCYSTSQSANLNVSPDITIDDSSTVEGTNNVFTISSSHSIGQDIVFNIGYTNISTTNADYSGPNTVTLLANTTSVSFNVAAVDDALIEPTETYETNISYLSGPVVNITDDTGIGTITDNDGGAGNGITFDNTNVIVDEDDGTATFTVRLTGNVPGGFTLDYTTADDTAIQPGDYSTTSGTLTFLGTDNESFDIVVPITNDNIHELTQSFNLNLSGLSTTLITINDPTATGTINDDDNASVFAKFVAVFESDLVYDLEVELNAPVEHAFTVDFETFGDENAGLGGTATAGTDYAANVSTTFTFPANSLAGTIVTIPITVIDDTIIEPSETIVQILDNISDPTIGILSPNRTFTIQDDDSNAANGISVSDFTVNEAAGTTTFDVSSNIGVQDGFSVDFAITNGSALNPDDYTVASTTGTLNFVGTVNEIQTVTVTIIDDAILEASEDLNITLSNITNVLVAMVDADGVGTITDNDGGGAGDGISVADFTVDESAGTTDFVITYTGPTVADAFTVDFAIADGTAISPDDYTVNVVTGNVSFPANTTTGTTQTVTVTIIDDAILEASEDLNITLSNITNVLVAMVDADGVGTITDNDSGGAGDGISVADFTVDENVGTTDFVITYTGPTVADAFTVDFAITDGTAISPDDYTVNVVTGIINFPANTISGTMQTIAVAIVDDTIIETDENLNITLSSITNISVAIVDGVGIGTIIDNDFIIDIDSDDDGILDSFEDLNADGDDDPSTNPTNSDSDIYPDYLDIDSDNDGIPDNVEAQTTDGYLAPILQDVNANGLDDAYEIGGELGLIPVNTDGEDLPDYLDLDSDNDSIIDAIEGNDQNHDGIADVVLIGSDKDNDGLDDGFEGDEQIDIDVNDEINSPIDDLPNTDGNEEVDYRDIDDDGDGIDTIDEDTDNNGDYTNDDFDNDGIPDYLDADQPIEYEDVEVFNVITPNGDGAHDFLMITGLDIRPDNTINIYNRWGILVYATESYDITNNRFDGTSQARATYKAGDLLPTGTYFYILNYVDIDSSNKSLSGHLYLN